MYPNIWEAEAGGMVTSELAKDTLQAPVHKKSKVRKVESFILYLIYTDLRWNDIICIWNAPPPQVPCVNGLVLSVEQLKVSSVLRQWDLRSYRKLCHWEHALWRELETPIWASAFSASWLACPKHLLLPWTPTILCCLLQAQKQWANWYWLKPSKSLFELMVSCIF